MSVWASCCESWRLLSANTRAWIQWTSSAPLEPSSPRSKVSCDEPVSSNTQTHTCNSQLSCKTSQLLLHSSFALFFVSSYLSPPSALTVLSPGRPLGLCPLSHTILPSLLPRECFWKLSYSFKVTQPFRSWSLKCSSMSSNLKGCQKKNILESDSGGRRHGCPLSARPEGTTQRILYSFPEIMIWHAGQFLTWPAHKNPPSLPRLHLHRKDELHSFLQSSLLIRTVTWWGKQSMGSRCGVWMKPTFTEIFGTSSQTRTHTCTH